MSDHPDYQAWLREGAGEGCKKKALMLMVFALGILGAIGFSGFEAIKAIV